MSKRLRSVEDLERLRERLREEAKKPFVSVCTGTGCVALGAWKVVEALRETMEEKGLEVRLKTTGCAGLCELGPRVTLFPGEIAYNRVMPEDVGEIVSGMLRGEVVERLLFSDSSGRKVVRLSEIPFYKHQLRLLLGKNVSIDPKRIEDYIAEGGYRALAKALFELSPEQVLVKRSGLSGRGFPTGKSGEGLQGSDHPLRRSRALPSMWALPHPMPRGGRSGRKGGSARGGPGKVHEVRHLF